ncbi:MAG: Gliding motility regulatory protein [Magnetococcales bacterium]|nr:Gliding motility regulatory protein [Magnetococcales bacterium]
MAFDRQKFLRQFVDGAREHIEAINSGIVKIEEKTGDAETLNEIFRAAHTLKGSSRMMKLIPISQTAHKIEDVLSSIRDGMALTSNLSDLLFAALDFLGRQVEKCLQTPDALEEDPNLLELLAKAAKGEEFQLQAATSVPQPKASPVLAETLEKKTAPAGKEPEEKPVATVAESPPPPAEPDSVDDASPGKTASQPEVERKEGATLRIEADRLNSVIQATGEVFSFKNRLKQRQRDLQTFRIRLHQHRERLQQFFSERESGIPHGLPLLDEATAMDAEMKRLSGRFKEDMELFGILLDDLQIQALSMRMVPLGHGFASFPRFLRDLAHSLGKTVRLEIQGSETSLDKVIVEKISGPLLHLLRNAVDHGIELPEIRKKLGKPETGTVRLLAWAEGNGVNIRVSDDGAGISIPRLKDKARKKNLVQDADMEKKSAAEWMEMIFLPGFSTAAIITDNSGRGVGMDVVKNEIVKDLKGIVKIDSREGQGTTFSIRIPLTLATLEILLVMAGGQHYAFPKSVVREIVKIPRNEIIAVVGRQAIRLREQVLPITSLKGILSPGTGHPETTAGVMHFILIIVSDGLEQHAFIVDELLDTMEIMLKALPYYLRGNRFLNGLFISGQDQIIGVLNVAHLIKMARQMNETSDVLVDEHHRSQQNHILVVDDSLNTREIEKEILQSYGYRVSVAKNGIEALEIINKTQFDLIVTDVEMPKMDGFTLTEKLRGIEEYRYVPIVIVTSRDNEADKNRGIQVGADAYIIKGAFDQNNLLDTVRNLMGT